MTNTPEDRRRHALRRRLALVLVVSMSVTAGYGLAYLIALRSPRPEHWSVRHARVHFDTVLRDSYRWFDDPARVFFWPANRLDRLARPEFWDPYRSTGIDPCTVCSPAPY